MTTISTLKEMFPQFEDKVAEILEICKGNEEMAFELLLQI
jgi:hypothetical protein